MAETFHTGGYIDPDGPLKAVLDPPCFLLTEQQLAQMGAAQAQRDPTVVEQEREARPPLIVRHPLWAPRNRAGREVRLLLPAGRSLGRRP